MPNFINEYETILLGKQDKLIILETLSLYFGVSYKFLNNEFFDKRCNGLEKYLLERGYSKKMVPK